jgi:hypothetical protein
MVCSGSSGFISYFQNTTPPVIGLPSISFATRQDFPVPGKPDNIAIADLDKDGRPDVITSNATGGNISVFQNLTTNLNFSLGSPVQYLSGAASGDVATGDLDGDGFLDVVVATANSIILFKNSGSGSMTLQNSGTINVLASNISIADLNGDGKPDLAIGKYGSGQVAIFENTSTGVGNISFGPQIDFTTGNSDTHVVAGDMDGDGKPELAVANSASYSVKVLKNRTGFPIVAAISPLVGNEGTLVTITGKNFTGTTDLKIGGVSASTFTVVSDTKIEVVVGLGASGKVNVTTTIGSDSSSTTFLFTPIISPSGATSFCNGSSLVITASPSQNYQWYKDGNIISGATSNSLTVNANGTYVVKTIGNGITTSSNSLIVAVTQVPKPVITINANGGFVSSAGSGNQWYKEGVAISGETQQVFRPTVNGTYTVRSKIDSCLSEFSDPSIFSTNRTIDLGNGQYIDLFPNPVRSRLVINWSIIGTSGVDVEIWNMQGRRVLLQTNVQSGTVINLSPLLPGIYYVRIFDNSNHKNYTVRIMKF